MVRPHWTSHTWIQQLRVQGVFRVKQRACRGQCAADLQAPDALEQHQVVLGSHQVLYLHISPVRNEYLHNSFDCVRNLCVCFMVRGHLLRSLGNAKGSAATAVVTLQLAAEVRLGPQCHMMEHQLHGGCLPSSPAQGSSARCSKLAGQSWRSNKPRCITALQAASGHENSGSDIVAGSSRGGSWPTAVEQLLAVE